MYQAQHNIFYIDGVPLYDLTIQQPKIDYAVSSFGRNSLVDYLRNDVTAWCRVPLVHNTAYQVLRLWTHRYCGTSVGILGKGYLCSHCGDYNPSGSLVCMKCGGAAVGKWLNPFGFTFYVSEWNQPILPPSFDEIEWISLEIVIPDFTEKTFQALDLMRGNNSFLANGYTLDSGLYLCKYCGQAVYEGDICPGCSGKRLPYQELVTIERECVYCGREVLGSIVCPGCGARIKGLTFGKVFGD